MNIGDFKDVSLWELLLLLFWEITARDIDIEFFGVHLKI